jgi:hypothetical protein
MDDMGTLTAANSGMSLRDYFAAKAMHAFLNASEPMRRPDKDGIWVRMVTFEDHATGAYQMADAMLAARQASAQPDSHAGQG